MHLWARVQLWWAARTTTPDRSDDDLADASRQITKALAQTLENRDYRRPSLTAANPRESAEAQRTFDNETIDQYHERIAPELAPLREEFIARGEWTPALDAVTTDPQSIGDLRELIIRLETITTGLAADDT